MTAEKKSDQATAARSQTQTAAPGTARKPWIKKSTADVVLEQIRKQEQKIADMEAAIKDERKEITKLQKVREILEAK
ncbi:MAG: hypothetical protein JWO13_441 [Acidobacteriales bacterium]|nr:hypothetical protein [Terriglobales bacterium]